MTYSLKGGTAADFMSDDEVSRYLQIDANGQVKVKAPLPNQDDGAVPSKLRAPVKFIVVATDSADSSKTTEHTVTLTIRNVLDETPTFTLPTGLTAIAGQTIFKDNAAKNLSVTTTETGGASPAHRVVEFFESSTEGHDNVEIARDGAITLTGSPAAGTISFKWYWKYVGESEISSDEITARSSTLQITVEPVEALAQRAPTFDNEHGGVAADTARESLNGSSIRSPESDLFKIDTTPGVYSTTEGRSIDIVTNFRPSEGDMLRFGADSDAMNRVDMELFVRFDDERLSAGPKDTLFIYKDQGDASSLLAILVDVGADFDLDNNHIWENATITPFKTTDGSAAGRQTLEGSSGKQTFKVDNGKSNAAGADVIKNFNQA